MTYSGGDFTASRIPERRGDRLEPVPITPLTQRHHQCFPFPCFFCKWLLGEADLPAVDLAALFAKCKLRKERHDIKAWRLCPCTTPLRLIA